MLKIYVSSTKLDLDAHRTRVSNVIRRLGDLDVAMEHYAAEEKRPLDRCLQDVADCDVYVGIFAWRSGFVPDGHVESITELEYAQAERLKKPRLTFLLDEDAPWPPKWIDKDRTAIERLRARVSNATVVAFFKSEDSLAAELSASLAKLQRDSGASSIAALDVEKYYLALRQRYLHLDLEALSGAQRDDFMQLRLQSVYVEQRVRESPPPMELSKDLEERLLAAEEIHAEDLANVITPDVAESLRQFREKYPPHPVLEVLAKPENARSIILGHPGSGKSTLSRYLILSLIDPDGDALVRNAFPQHLPVVIELKSYCALRRAGKCDTFFDYLDYLAQTEGWGLSKSALSAYFGGGQPALVMFDGLDEIFDSGEREAIAHQVTGFTRDFPAARVIVTSRILGYRRKILTDAGFVHLTLQDFEEDQVSEFARKWVALAMPNRPADVEERIARLTRAYSESPSIRQLAGVPMLLTIMAIIGKNQELPRERWKLYDHAASVLVQHWDVNKHLGTQLLAEDDKRDLLRALAWRMQAAKGGIAGNYIHRDDLLDEFEKYLRARFGHDAGQAARIAREMIDQFRERNYILASLGASLYGFVHRAFLEYFCADAIVTRFEKTDLLTIEQLKKSIFAAHADDRAWHEVLRLICGKIGEQFAGEIIRFFLAGKKPRLAVECVTEVRNVAAIAEVVGEVTESVLEALVGDLFERMAGDIDLRPLMQLTPSISSVVRWLASPHAADARYPLTGGDFLGSAIRGNLEIYPQLERVAMTNGGIEKFAISVLSYGYADWPSAQRTFRTIIFDVTRADAVREFALLVGEFTIDELIRLAMSADSALRTSAIVLLRDRMKNQPDDIRTKITEALAAIPTS
jgi:energy-coupling factor transporter ATP-binding protein EcfA2